MKKIWLALFLTVFGATSVMAMPRPHHRPSHHGHPAPIVQKVSVHHHDGWGNFFAGLVGSAIGSYIVTNQYQPTIYSDTRCVVMKSRLSGQVVKKCVNLANSQNWAQQDVYDILYVE